MTEIWCFTRISQILNHQWPRLFSKNKFLIHLTLKLVNTICWSVRTQCFHPVIEMIVLKKFLCSFNFGLRIAKSVCSSVRLSINPSVCQLNHSSVHLSINLSVSVRLSVCLSFCQLMMPPAVNYVIRIVIISIVIISIVITSIVIISKVIISIVIISKVIISSHYKCSHYKYYH